MANDQFVFIDNIVFDCDSINIEDLEQQKFEEAREQIKTFTESREKFICQDIKEVQKENDRIKAEMEE